ncbi:MAG: hypothetical protein ABJO52_20945 [Nisaea sp.]|uniref:hypothetical protein n=1 Tax=Nisaea sp. TaxID=2024842 RepID=UPI00329A374D
MKIYIGTVSFESRSSAIVRRNDQCYELGFIFCSREVEPYLSDHLSYFKKKIGNIRHIQTSYDDTVDNLQKIQGMVLMMDQIQSDEPLTIEWDISVTRRELISLILLALRDLTVPYKLKILYSDAGNYSTNEPEGKKWLSKGVKKVGTILGFNGLFYARKSFHLVVYLGLESERIRALIEKTEPQFVTFFRPKSDFPSIEEDRERVFKEVQPKCDFSVEYIANTDPTLVCEEILKRTANREWNYGLCSFNSKISAVGFALAALKNRELRLFYVWAEAYNKKYYSEETDIIIEHDIILPA